ncbi:MAG: FISUMP domain-containing protein [Paludibacter sp.]
MKKLVFFSLAAILLVAIAVAQVPSRFSYQAIVRDEAGNSIKNKEVAVRFSVLSGSVSGSQVYTETQRITTNANGLMTTEIGKDTLTTSLKNIPWGSGSYFLKTEIDLNDGSNFTLNSVSQLISVPYALFAEKANQAKSAESISLTSPDGYNYDLKVDNTGKIIPTVVPKLATLDSITVINSVSFNGFNLTNKIINTGKDSISQCGICWSTSPNPVISGSHSTGTLSSLSFTTAVTGLAYNTIYYVRPYSTNKAGISYGKPIQIKTPCLLLTTPSPIAGDSAAVMNSQAKTYSIAAVSGAKSYFWKVPVGAAIVSGQGTATITVNFGTQSGDVKVCAVNECDSSDWVSKTVVLNYSSDSEFIGTSGTFTDIRDGNTYKWVKIGTQIWMAENLKAVKYRNGDPITNVTDNTTWFNSTAGAYCWYNNDYNNYGKTYGALYNWYTVAESRGIAPQGWHVPSGDEWIQLYDFLGGSSLIVDSKLKSVGPSFYPNTDATNSSGFSALPSGLRRGNTGVSLGFGASGTFDGYTAYTEWWGNTLDASSNAFVLYLDWVHTSSSCRYNYGIKTFGFPIRCVKDIPCPTLTAPVAISGKDTLSTNATAQTYSIVAVTNATSYRWKVPSGASIASGQGTASITVNFGTQSGKIEVCAVNECDSSDWVSKTVVLNYSSDSEFIGTSGTFTDIRDGNTYKWVKIGTQIWMAENLKAVKYRNGDVVPNVTDNTAWAALTTGAWCDYNNIATNDTKYGHLYNWYTASDSRNIAPTGWHVPTDAEWTTLTTYLGGQAVAGGKLKEAGTLNWNSPNTGATNETGFSALPGGLRNFSDGSFGGVGNNGNWWSSSENNATYVWRRYMNWSYSSVGRSSSSKTYGFSVCCVRD